MPICSMIGVHIAVVVVSLCEMFALICVEQVFTFRFRPCMQLQSDSIIEIWVSANSQTK